MNDQFIAAVKEGVNYQRLTGDIMSYVEYDGQSLCPFCGRVMTAELDNGVMKRLTCICDQSIEVNRRLNALIKIVEDAQDDCMTIYKEVDRAALLIYKRMYESRVYPMQVKQLEEDRAAIMAITSLE
jgi:hypothetical protein